MPSAAPSRCRDPARGRAELLFRGCGATRACDAHCLHRARRHDPSIERRSGSWRREPCSSTCTDRAVGPAGRDRAAATALASRYAGFRAGIEASLVVRSDSGLLLLPVLVVRLGDPSSPGLFPPTDDAVAAAATPQMGEIQPRDRRLTMIAHARCRLATSRRSALADRDAAGESGGRPRSWSHPNNRWGRIGGPTS